MSWSNTTFDSKSTTTYSKFTTFDSKTTTTYSKSTLKSTTLIAFTTTYTRINSITTTGTTLIPQGGSKGCSGGAIATGIKSTIDSKSTTTTTYSKSTTFDSKSTTTTTYSKLTPSPPPVPRSSSKEVQKGVQEERLQQASSTTFDSKSTTTTTYSKSTTFDSKSTTTYTRINSITTTDTTLIPQGGSERCSGGAIKTDIKSLRIPFMCLLSLCLY
ncbi:hypothetical protein TSUD_276660 [Trifolium subterraneum]|uniref:Uncharacterized protein n=1 Tax=Trifolium subterraneum TaxID=3900 RepID=A0A2Z6N1C4_TRISU|nr:hypothetical protein TSUD_276660 [Trifolium subterraneum]